jgi:hypothetical protein
MITATGLFSGDTERHSGASAPVPISFTLELEDLDYQRANRR